MLAASYLAPDHFILCRIRQCPARQSPRFGYLYKLESLDPHPHRFISRCTSEIILPLTAP